MTTRLRQAVVAASDLEGTVRQLRGVLGIEVGFHDPGVAEFGLRNAVLPVGDQFLEVVSPAIDGSAAGRFIERRGGDGGYMLLVQVDDEEVTRQRAADLGFRTVWKSDVPAGADPAAEPAIKGTHLHPKDTGGCLLSFDQPDPPASWRWGGPAWIDHVRTGVVSGIDAVDIETDDPAGLAGTWAALFGAVVDVRPDRTHVLRLDDGAVRFRPAPAGGGDQVVGVELRPAPGSPAVDATIAGVRFRSAGA